MAILIIDCGYVEIIFGVHQSQTAKIRAKASEKPQIEHVAKYSFFWFFYIVIFISDEICFIFIIRGLRSGLGFKWADTVSSKTTMDSS